ncbi:amidohydrolase family protein [Marinobacter nanhaiticus D15-8W]|uniref:Amidohydrolase n=1 Tax=Marinobacter nanhaiticus D15-8W TaxID=626887 RepID=N6W3U3_9GAMM|nr:amidohydrolase family protein [Marinobacter nanhaiticus]ENO14799.1 amidohydrolase [Marinobacter nanhaiticus D15-8W]BES69512.1 amidohydrolase family protein [Marinobacter nanhaiticus D15-8W]
MNQLILKKLRLPDATETIIDCLIEDGFFVERLSPRSAAPQQIDLAGRLILPGLIETHIHLDKACIMDRCRLSEGTLAEAISQTSQAKAAFTEDDVYARGVRVLEQAIAHGTTLMRTHVEIDPGIGLTGFEAIKRLRKDYAWAVDLEICVFPQEGLLNNPGTEELLCQALENGATVLGGCPYMDSDPEGQIRRLFELARHYDCDLDLHLDFDLNPEGLTVPEVIRCTRENNWGGRVTIGHATKLSALCPDHFNALALDLAEAGVQVTALPATDLFLTGRDATRDIPRGVAPLARLHRCGVTCSLSTNNVGNPFTPFGDVSLIRQANLYANIAHLGTTEDMLKCLGWISSESARLLGRMDYGLAPGCRADFIVLDAQTPAEVIAGIQQPLMGFKGGRQTFERQPPKLLSP